MSYHPKRTQEIATVLYELLGSTEVQLPKKIVSHLKETETEMSREYHACLKRPEPLVNSLKAMHEEMIEFVEECNWHYGGEDPEPSETLYLIGLETRGRICDRMCDLGLSTYEIDCKMFPEYTKVYYPHWHIRSYWWCSDFTPLSEKKGWIYRDGEMVGVER